MSTVLFQDNNNNGITYAITGASITVQSQYDHTGPVLESWRHTHVFDTYQNPLCSDGCYQSAVYMQINDPNGLYIASASTTEKRTIAMDFVHLDNNTYFSTFYIEKNYIDFVGNFLYINRLYLADYLNNFSYDNQVQLYFYKEKGNKNKRLKIKILKWIVSLIF